MALEITAEVQEAIDAAVEAATSGLKNKNTELLGELKKARKAGEITPEQLADVEADRDKIAADLAKAQKDLKTANGNVEKLQKSLNDESGFTQRLLIDNGLTSELTKNNVTNPALLEAAIAYHRSNIKVEIDGENRVAKYGDKPMADAIKEWAASDKGKHFVTAAANSGGGATGGGGSHSAEDVSKMSPQQKMEAGRTAKK